MKKTEPLSLKVTPGLKQRIADMAAQKERSMNWLAAKYLEDGLARDGSPDPEKQKKPN